MTLRGPGVPWSSQRVPEVPVTLRAPEISGFLCFWEVLGSEVPVEASGILVTPRSQRSWVS